MTSFQLRTSFAALPCLLLLSACGATAGTPGGTSTSSLSSTQSFPLGVQTSCRASLIQSTQGLSAVSGLRRADSLPTVTLTSSGSTLTATFNDTASPLAPVKLTAVSGASATVVAGQTWTVPVWGSAPTPSQTADLPIDGGSMTFDGDSFFLSLEMSLQGSAGTGTVVANFECAAGEKAPADCVCSGADECTCRSAATPPLGVYTQCVTDVDDVETSGGTSGGDTTVTLAEQNGALTMTIGGGSNPVAAGTLDLTPTSAATATIAGGQSLGAPNASPTKSCTPGGDLWTPPEWPLSVESGSLTTDGRWLTVSLAGKSPCSTQERIAVVCAARMH